MPAKIRHNAPWEQGIPHRQRNGQNTTRSHRQWRAAAGCVANNPELQRHGSQAGWTPGAPTIGADPIAQRRAQRFATRPRSPTCRCYCHPKPYNQVDTRMSIGTCGLGAGTLTPPDNLKRPPPEQGARPSDWPHKPDRRPGQPSLLGCAGIFLRWGSCAIRARGLDRMQRNPNATPHTLNHKLSATPCLVPSVGLRLARPNRPRGAG